MTINTLNIPDLFSTPYCTTPVELNNEVYYFEYSWNNRHGMAYLSIYLLDNNIPNYILKRICLVNGIEISRYIINDRWSGGLFFESKTQLIPLYPRCMSSVKITS